MRFSYYVNEGSEEEIRLKWLLECVKEKPVSIRHYHPFEKKFLEYTVSGKTYLKLEDFAKKLGF